MSEWISVKERLPDKDGFYLVAYNEYEWGIACKRATISMRFRTGKEAGVPKGFICDAGRAVTHWMPLPEPPKEESK